MTWELPNTVKTAIAIMDVARKECWRDEGNRRLKRGKLPIFEPPSAVIAPSIVSVYVLACFHNWQKESTSRQWGASTFSVANHPYRAGDSALSGHFNADLLQLVAHVMRTRTRQSTTNYGIQLTAGEYVMLYSVDYPGIRKSLSRPCGAPV